MRDTRTDTIAYFSRGPGNLSNSLNSGKCFIWDLRLEISTVSVLPFTFTNCPNGVTSPVITNPPN